MVRSSRIPILMLLVAAVLAVPVTSGAQSRAEISGTVVDPSKAVLPGVTVTLSSPNMIGGVRTAVTNAAGAYRFVEMPPGIYELTATLQGFNTVKRGGVRLDYGAVLTIDFEMTVGGVSETVEVKAASPTIEVKTAAANMRIDADLIQALPPDGNILRSGYDILLNAPGVATTRVAFGSTGVNNLMIDGISSASAQIGNVAGSTLSPDWMQEVQVVGLGAPAEYGETAGIASNMVIRSGSNRFSGLFNVISARPQWQGDNTYAGCPDHCVLPAAQQGRKGTRTLSNWNVTAQIGGPLWRDKLFFFGGFNYYVNKVLQQFTLSTTPERETFPRAIFKPTWAVSPSVRVEGYIEHDVSTRNNAGGSATVQPEAMYDSYNPKTMYNLRGTWTPSNTTFVEVRNGGNVFMQQLYSLTHDCGPDAPRMHRDSTGMTSVNSMVGCNTQNSNRNITVGTVTHFLENRLGISHELKAGAEFERSWYQTTSGYPGGGYYSDLNGAPNQLFLTAGSLTEGTTKRYTAFVQDNWVLTRKITLQPGVRYTRNRGSVPAIKNAFKTDYVDARVGVAWDLFSDHKSVVRVHYGRFRDAAYTILFDYMDIAKQSPTYIYSYSAATQAWNLISTSIPSNNKLINSDLTHAYVDQFLVGFDRELFPDFSLSVNYIHRFYGHIFAVKEINRTWTPYATGVRDPGPDGKLSTADDGELINGFVRDNVSAAYQLISPSDATRTFDGIQFVARKRFSKNWQAQLSYTFSKTYGRVSNFGNNGYAQGADVGNSGQWANPNTRINAVGRGQNDKPHLFLGTGTYRVPWFGGFNASVSYRIESGIAWGRTAPLVFPSPTSTQTIRIEPRGTRRLGMQHIFSTRLEKTFPLLKRYNVGAFVDVFNMLNAGQATSVNEASGASFGNITAITASRRFQVGLRLTF